MAVDLCVEGFHALNNPEKLQSVPDGASITVRRMPDGSVFINVVPPAQQACERTEAASSEDADGRAKAAIDRYEKRLSDLELTGRTNADKEFHKDFIHERMQRRLRSDSGTYLESLAAELQYLSASFDNRLKRAIEEMKSASEEARLESMKSILSKGVFIAADFAAKRYEPHN